MLEMSASSTNKATRPWRHVTNRTFNKQRDSHLRLFTHSWYVISVHRHVRSWYALEADISSMYCKDNVTFYTVDDFGDNDCQSCLCHVKFPIAFFVKLVHIWQTEQVFLWHGVETFHMRCQRHILRIGWFEFVRMRNSSPSFNFHL